MCGIAGIIEPDSPESNRIETMIDVMNYRGPDDRGFYSNDQLTFGMCRLSIIDPEGGKQPMWTEDGMGIIFNGEIYNYRSIREELKHDGYKFETDSDTEVVLKLYHRDGLPGIDRLNGMFAIAIYDKPEKNLHLVRDRLGIKPLYYSQTRNGFYFASETKSILSSLRAKPNLDEEALSHYLTLRFVPTNMTMWEDIDKLEPGHSLTYQLDKESVTKNRYWNLQFRSEPADLDRDYASEFRERFVESVNRRILASDVPVGTLLSGGLDSSAITAAAIEAGHRDFHTFNISFEGHEDFDESKFARQTADHLNTRHHEITIDRDDYFNFMPDFVSYTDDPIADPAAIPLYYVCQLAREHVKVVLSGEGADEMLAGYDMNKLAQKIKFAKIAQQYIPGSVWKALSSVLPRTVAEKYIEDIKNHPVKNILKNRVFHITYYWTGEEKQQLLKNIPPVTTEDLITGWYRNSKSSEPLDQIQEVYMKQWLVEDLLMKGDRMSMANSLELRVPFLDHKLVEWSSRAPISCKVGEGYFGLTTKKILRDYCKSVLPEAIYSRPKQGFSVPVFRWIKHDEDRMFEEFICSNSSQLSNYLNMDVVKREFKRLRNGKGSPVKIWTLYVLENWMREWL